MSSKKSSVVAAMIIAAGVVLLSVQSAGATSVPGQSTKAASAPTRATSKSFVMPPAPPLASTPVGTGAATLTQTSKPPSKTRQATQRPPMLAQSCSVPRNEIKTCVEGWSAPAVGGAAAVKKWDTKAFSETAAATQKAASTDASSAVDPSELEPLPEDCDAALTGPYQEYTTRYYDCETSQFYYEVITTSGEVLGSATFYVVTYTYSSNDLTDFVFQAAVFPEEVDGDVGDLTISGQATCNPTVEALTCQDGTQDFPSQSALSESGAQGVSGFNWVQGTDEDFGINELTYSFTLLTDIGTPADTGAVIQSDVRCDNQLTGYPAGCIMLWDQFIDTLTYHSSSLPDFARHVAAAQASGLPGSIASGSPLTREGSSGWVDYNRTIACPSAYVRPTGLSCDEYPFASSEQGAGEGTQAGRTFSWCQIPELPQGTTGPEGYSACMVNATQNSTAGSLLNSQLYVPQRIIRDDPYYIEIAP